MLSALLSRFEFLKQFRRGNVGDGVFRFVALLFALFLLVITFGIIYELWTQSVVARQEFGWSFLWSTEWQPQAGNFGALPLIYGTLVSSAFAILLAGPIGVGIAAYLVEIAPRRLNKVIGFVVEMLAAVPSIVYGFWGLYVLAPFLGDYVVPPLRATLGWIPLFSGNFVGATVFTASLVLSIMILPTVAAISRDVIQAVSDDLREGMLALGATRWEMFRRAVLPAAKSGILGAVSLGLGRAAGETMAVTLIMGTNPQIFNSLFEQGATMSSIIAATFQESSGVAKSALIEIALVLFIITFAINVGARLLMLFLNRGPQGGA